MCLGALMINDIRHIVFAYEDVMGGACGTDFSRPITAMRHNMEPGHGNRHIYVRYGVECDSEDSGRVITGGVMRRESLSLFYEFFSRDSCEYLRDTYLAQYTLQQGRGL